MKLCTFHHPHGKRVPGAVVGDRVVDLERALREQRGLTERVADLGTLLRHPTLDRDGVCPRAELAAVVDRAAALIADRGGATDDTLAPRLDAVRLAAPIARPPVIWAVGLNYRDHAEEQNKQPPAQPMLFTKAPTSVIGPGEPIELPAGRDAIDAEAELGIVIGRRASAPVPSERALAHVLGFTVCNDVSDRAAQKSDRQYCRAKSWRTFAPMGPVVVTPDAVGDAADLGVEQRLNGEVWQRSRTDQLIFSAAHLVAWISDFCDLEPGTVISTGTPGGVGVFRDPPVFLRDGDLVECEVEGIGTLRNPVIRRDEGSS